MNEHDIASNSPAPAPASSGSVSGQARIEHIGSEPGIRAGGSADSRTQAPWGNATTPGGSRLPSNTLLGDFVGRALGFISDTLNPPLVQQSLALAKRWGHYAVLTGAVLTLAYAIYGAIKGNSFAIFAIGLGLVVALGVAQFAAMRFLDAADSLIASTPGRVVSSAFLECAGLLAILFAVASLLGGIAGAIAASTIFPLLPALFTGTVFASLGALALHPALVNTHPGTGTAGEEAIGLLSFAAKAGLKVAPLFFALLAAAGGLALLSSFVVRDGPFASAALSGLNLFPIALPFSGAQAGSALVIMACLVPMFAYAGFLVQHLVIDLLRAVLSLPGKIDSLRR